METLPEEMVRYIARMLSPRDLASCCGVSHQWRDIFNQDPIWKPHCNPRLEKSLKTIPCTTTILLPLESVELLQHICHWRLVLMREQIFLRNWRTYDTIETREIMPNFNHDDCQRIDFLTDTLILVFYSSSIEVLDVSAWPAVLVAKSVDSSVADGIWPWKKYELRELEKGTTSVCVHNNSLSAKLYVLKEFSLEVYQVDGLNKNISLKHSMSLGLVNVHDFHRDYYIVLSEKWFTIICMKTLNVLKKCPVPFKTNLARYEITTSIFSNLIAVHILFDDWASRSFKKYFVFSLEKFIFLPSLLAEVRDVTATALHDQYMAVNGSEGLSIYDCITQEVVLKTPSFWLRSDGEAIVVERGFIIAEEDEQDTLYVYIYCPSRRSKINLFHHGYEDDFVWLLLSQILIRSPSRYFEWTWEVFGHRTDTSEIELVKLSRALVESCGAEPNKSFTKVVLKFGEPKPLFKYTWKIKNLY